MWRVETCVVRRYGQQMVQLEPGWPCYELCLGAIAVIDQSACVFAEEKRGLVRGAKHLVTVPRDRVGPLCPCH